jgi:hypothetical protein
MRYQLLKIALLCSRPGTKILLSYYSTANAVEYASSEYYTAGACAALSAPPPTNRSRSLLPPRTQGQQVTNCSHPIPTTTLRSLIIRSVRDMQSAILRLRPRPLRLSSRLKYWTAYLGGKATYPWTTMEGKAAIDYEVDGWETRFALLCCFSSSLCLQLAAR